MNIQKAEEVKKVIQIIIDFVGSILEAEKVEAEMFIKKSF